MESNTSAEMRLCRCGKQIDTNYYKLIHKIGSAVNKIRKHNKWIKQIIENGIDW